jgi:thiol-disulfide isomerase/thioredoxin
MPETCELTGISPRLPRQIGETSGSALPVPRPVRNNHRVDKFCDGASLAGNGIVMQSARSGMWTSLTVTALALLGCGTSTTPTVKREPAATSAADKTTPLAATTDAIELKELSWDQLQEVVARHKGKVVVVDIWSTSCEPCLREFPHLVALQQRHPDDVICISFDCDYIGAKNKAVGYYRERVLKQLTSQHAEKLINGMSTVAADELFQQLDIDSIPAVYVYDRAGRISKRFDNRTPAGDSEEGISYEKQIDPLVADLVKADNI